MDRQYPLTIDENIKYRADLILKCEQDEQLRQEVYDLCSKDIIYWIDTFCWTSHPKEGASDEVPFICYDCQVDAILDIQQAIEEGYDVLLEKTREMGASWIALYIIKWFMIFRKGSTFRTGSWKEDYVDKIGDMDSHFEKLRFINKRLPRWMVERNEIPYMKCLLSNGSSVVGETANKNWGSGGRKKALILDEFAKWDNSQSDGAWTSSADISNCRIVISTPYGNTNKYAKLANGEEGKIKVITLHWTLHPEKAHGCYKLEEDGSKTPLKPGKEAFEAWKRFRLAKAPHHMLGGIIRSTWYDAECERRGNAQDIAQELDIDYVGSGYPFFDIYGIDKQRTHQKQPIRIGNLFRVAYGEIEFRDDPTGMIRVYEVPDKIEDYRVTADASKARGLDEASAYVGNMRINTTAAVVNGQYDADQLGDVCVLLAEWYNNAMVAPENSCGYGNNLTKCIYNQYNNIYVMPHRKKESVRLNQLLKPQDMGFVTSGKTRPDCLSSLEREIRVGGMWLWDKDIIDQCESFVINESNNKAEAAPGKQDGLVICRAIFSYLRDEIPFVERITKRDKRLAFIRERQELPNVGISYGGVRR